MSTAGVLCPQSGQPNQTTCIRTVDPPGCVKRTRIRRSWPLSENLRCQKGGIWGHLRLFHGLPTLDSGLSSGESRLVLNTERDLWVGIACFACLGQDSHPFSRILVGAANHSSSPLATVIGPVMGM